MIYLLRESRHTTYGTHSLHIRGVFTEKYKAENVKKELEAKEEEDKKSRYEIIEIEPNYERDIEMLYLEWK